MRRGRRRRTPAAPRAAPTAVRASAIAEIDSRSSASHSRSGVNRHASAMPASIATPMAMPMSRTRRAAALMSLWREIGDDAVGIDRLLRIEHVAVGHERVERGIEPRLDGHQRARTFVPSAAMARCRLPSRTSAAATSSGAHPRCSARSRLRRPAISVAKPRLAARFDREVAFGVDAERALGQVRRPEHQQRVVDDQHLAVDVETAVAVIEPGERRAIQAIARVAIRRRAARDGCARAARPSSTSRAIRFAYTATRTAISGPSSSSSRRANASAIVRDVKYWFSAKMCRFAAAIASRCRARISATPRSAVERRLGARNRDIDVGGRDRDVFRPWISIVRIGGRYRRCSPVARCQRSRAKLAERARTVAADDDADVVERRIRLAAMVDATRHRCSDARSCPSGSASDRSR